MPSGFRFERLFFTLNKTLTRFLHADLLQLCYDYIRFGCDSSIQRTNTLLKIEKVVIDVSYWNNQIVVARQVNRMYYVDVWNMNLGVWKHQKVKKINLGLDDCVDLQFYENLLYIGSGAAGNIYDWTQKAKFLPVIQHINVEFSHGITFKGTRLYRFLEHEVTEFDISQPNHLIELSRRTGTSLSLDKGSLEYEYGEINEVKLVIEKKTSIVPVWPTTTIQKIVLFSSGKIGVILTQDDCYRLEIWSIQSGKIIILYSIMDIFWDLKQISDYQFVTYRRKKLEFRSAHTGRVEAEVTCKHEIFRVCLAQNFLIIMTEKAIELWTMPSNNQVKK
jgi:hypothetical protein